MNAIGIAILGVAVQIVLSAAIARRTAKNEVEKHRTGRGKQNGKRTFPTSDQSADFLPESSK